MNPKFSSRICNPHRREQRSKQSSEPIPRADEACDWTSLEEVASLRRKYSSYAMWIDITLIVEHFATRFWILYRFGTFNKHGLFLQKKNSSKGNKTGSLQLFHCVLMLLWQLCVTLEQVKTRGLRNHYTSQLAFALHTSHILFNPMFDLFVCLDV